MLTVHEERVGLVEEEDGARVLSLGEVGGDGLRGREPAWTGDPRPASK